MAEQRINELLDDLFLTTRDVEQFSLRLDTLLEKLYATTIPLDTLLSQTVSQKEQALMAQMLTTQGISHTDKTAIRACFQTLLAMLAQKKVLHLTLASEPTQQIITTAQQWCQRELALTPLIRITVDPNILGGCLLAVDGSWKDYSVRKAFKEHEAYILDAFYHHA